MIEKGVSVMKKHIVLILAAAIILLPASSMAEDKPDQYSQTIKLFRDSPVVKTFFNNAYGYAVLPVIGKGGVGIGGAFGKGKVYRGGKLTGRVTMLKLSFGFQLGGQAFSEAIFFQDKRAYEEFISGTFEFDATASAVAITAGAQAKVGTTGKTAGVSSGPATGKQLAGKYVKGMAVFVHVKGGLMYEASIGGQVFSFEKL
jgi:lipid-binding SYLF domain-containing protein